MIRQVVLGVLVVVGCKGKASQEPAPTPAPAPAPAPKAKSGSAVEDSKLRAAYRAGMAQGRKATDKKQWAEAIAGFDAALAAKKSDPRALAERGFARLLEGSDLDGAWRDLDRAAGGTKDVKLQSMIWFNRGLVEEKRGNAINATAAFTIANVLRPTAAAKAKLAGKTPCPIDVEHALVTGEAKVVEGADWIALVKALPFDEPSTATTKEDAWMLATGERTEPALPITISAGDSTEKVSYLVLRGGAGLRAIPLGVASGGRCPGTVSYDVVEADATRILVRGADMYEGGYTFMCEGKDGERTECTGADTEVAAGTACFGGTPTRREIVIDAATGKVLLVLAQPDGESAAKGSLAPGGVKLVGLGCDRVQPLE